MKKRILEVPVLSDIGRSVGLPASFVTIANGFIFVSGVPPFDLNTGKLVEGDIRLQTETSLKAVEHCLHTAGSSLDDVVMTRVYTANAGFFPFINEVYARFFPTNPPSRTFVPVASWHTTFDIEIECIAVA